MAMSKPKLSTRINRWAERSALMELAEGGKGEQEFVKVKFPVCVDCDGNVYLEGFHSPSSPIKEGCWLFHNMEQACLDSFFRNYPDSAAEAIHWATIEVPIPKRPESVEIVAEVEDV